MSDQLREAFRDLAADGPEIDATAATSSRTWQRARQARRRGVVAVSLAVVAVIVGGLLAAVALSDITRPAPVAPPPYDASKLAIPNQIWIPSSWTKGTDDAGPLGPLALIGTAPRHTSWLHTEDNALFGVSAATGEYRFIDLPDFDIEAQGSTGEAVSLSPDGTKIAYWLLGTIDTAASQPNDVGVAVYDTATGVVSRHLVPSSYGLMPDWLAWSADSASLAFQYGLWSATGSRQGGGEGHSGATLGWNLDSTRVVSLPAIDSNVGPAPGGVGYFSGGSLNVANPSDGTVRRISGVGASEFARLSVVSAPIVSPSLDAVAAEVQPDAGIGPKVYETGLSGTTEASAVRIVPGARPFVIDLFGWADDHTLLIQQWQAGGTSGGADTPPQIYRVAVTTHERTLAIRVNGSQWLNPAFATDLLQREFASRPQPPDVRGPWAAFPGWVIGVLALALVLWLLLAGVRRSYGRDRDIESSFGAYP